jgi:hypothetical protein
MKIKVQVVIEAENGKPEKVEEIFQLERGSLRIEELGLTISEAKMLMHGMQQTMVTEQISDYLEQFKTCPNCGTQRKRKGKHSIVYRTLFGKLRINSPRLYDCPCQNQGRHSSSPLAKLLTTHCAPELQYLETKFASLMSYGLSVKILTEVLPIADEINHTSLRRQVNRVAERIEAELGEEQAQFIEGCPNEWAKQPAPGPPLTWMEAMCMPRIRNREPKAGSKSLQGKVSRPRVMPRFLLLLTNMIPNLSVDFTSC